MINARELRIGNYVKYGHQFLRLKAFDEELETVAFGTIRASFIADPHRMKEKLEPIPLTPEILTEWCGFEKTVFKETYSLENFFYEMGISVEFIEGGLIFSFNFTAVQITNFEKLHLHWFQNLIFSLTGKELEIKIPGRVATH